MAKEPWGRERCDPLRHRQSHGVLREHLARYRFAAELLHGRVLDAGCGTGYGSLILASGESIERVVAVDRDRRALALGRRYYRDGRIRFREADLLDGALVGEAPFDGIACLEVLEHVSDPERLLAALDRLLGPGGTLLVSTPLGKGRQQPSSQPGHHFQLRRVEFERMLTPRYRFRLYGLRGTGIEVYRPGGRYFLLLAWCRARGEQRCAGGRRRR
jgi:2-polyprenyl-3-methyl-5-hydroxy-6-metoxy-1,4-benzoquinol methylase